MIAVGDLVRYHATRFVGLVTNVGNVKIDVYAVIWSLEGRLDEQSWYRKDELRLVQSIRDAL